MTRQEMISLINGIEERYPVDQWFIGDIAVWPIIKVNMFNRWCNKYNAEFASYNSLIKSNAKKIGAVEKTLNRAASIFNLTTLLFTSQKQVPVIFVGANNYRVNVNNTFINKYFEPISRFLKKEYDSDSLFLEYQPEENNQNYAQADKTFFLNKYYGAAKLIQLLKRKKEVVTLPGFSDAINELNEVLPEFMRYEHQLNYLQGQVKSIRAYAFLFDSFFKKYAPRYVMGLCYYNLPGYAMCYAAQKHKVISIDMQHGGQGDLHSAYASYNKVAAKGFNTFPQIFWCWDKPSYDVINAWIVKQQFHKVLLGGNPWLSYSEEMDENTYDFPDKKILLYTMQLNQPEDYIIEAIKNTPANYVWWLRLHPRALNTQAHLEELLKTNGIFEMVEINKATQYSLPAVLRHTTIHLSNYSGSVIEAAQIGIKTIIIGEVGVKTYSALIETGDAVACIDQSSEKLIETILKLDDESARKNNNYDYKATIKELIDNQSSLFKESEKAHLV